MTENWLGTLEDRVREAAAELGRLREENERLRERLGKAAARLPAAWEKERAAIRERVERLVAQLEGLLGGG